MIPGRMDLESSLELIKKAQDGDAQALNRLLSRYLPRLQQWASRRLPRHARDLADTDDLVQEAVIRTLKHLKTFDYRREGALQAYLRTAVMNRLRDEMRRTDRRPQHDELPVTVADEARSPLEAAIGREAVERYERALEQLTEADREAVIMRLEFGCDFQEIAVAVGKPTADAARMAVVRAVESLAQRMSEFDDGADPGPDGAKPGPA